MTRDLVTAAAGPLRDQLCKQRLIGKVCGPRWRAWCRGTGTEGQVGNAAAQEVEGDVGYSPAGPTLRRERERFCGGGTNAAGCSSWRLQGSGSDY